MAALAAAVLLAALVLGPARGQSPAQSPAPAVAEPISDASPLDLDRGAAGVWQLLLKLRTRASLLMVTAHPDDEDGGMLTYQSRGQGTRAALLSLTRGEGGQNIMSDHFYDALGLVRTHELLAADRYYGVDQYWSSVVDFGFSKSPEETLAQWGRERVLADVVRVVRMTRPLVVASVFAGGPTDGHGHHSVAGQMAQEVFNAASDPNMFPEQIRAGLRPWSPLKMYARVPMGGGGGRVYSHIEKKWLEGPVAASVEVPTGMYDPVLGSSYLQIARRGWSLQKSQNGGGGTPLSGPATVLYHRFGSRVAAGERERSFFDGVDVSLAGIADLAQGQDSTFLRQELLRVSALIERAVSEFSAAQPEKIAPLLAEGLKETNALLAQVPASGLTEQAKYDVLRELDVKREQFERAVVASLGLSLSATVGPRGAQSNRNFAALPSETFAYAVPGQEFAVSVRLYNPAATPLTLGRVWLEAPAGETWTIQPESPVPSSAPLMLLTNLAAGQAMEQRYAVRVPDNAAATRPYFRRPDNERPYYDIADERNRNLSLAPYPLSAWLEFNIAGATVRTGQVVQTVRRQVGQGLVLQPLAVAPAISVLISPPAGATPLGSKSFSLSALVHGEAEAGAKGTVRLELPSGWRCVPAAASFTLERAGEEQSVSFQVFPDRLQEKPYTVTAVAESGGRQYREGFVTAGYTALRPYNLYQPATYRTSGVDVKVAPGLRVGYVTGTGDSMPQSLENLGIKTEFLSSQDLATGDLQKFNVIILGVRAYAARPELATYNSRVLEYIRNGGVAVLQYNTVEYNRNFGPYPYDLPNAAERVVDETAAINFLDPQSPVLTWPNRLSQNDFAGWVEERGHGFLTSWDSRYQAPLETHDPGQAPQRGGLVYARYGRGVYVYTALALYRQLPEGVPGSYRLFANLLSLPRNPALQLPALRGGPVRPAVPQR
jgi:LmbE family N-acetylglucosaminyl deacetylase